MNYKNEYTKNEYTLRMNYKLRNIAIKKNHKKNCDLYYLFICY